MRAETHPETVTRIQREAGEAKGQSGLSTSHWADDVRLDMPPSRATSRITHDHAYGEDCAEMDAEARTSAWAASGPHTDFSDRAFMIGYIGGLAESIRAGRYDDREAIAASLDYLLAQVQR